VVATLAMHITTRNGVQLLVHERREPFEDFFVAFLPSLQKDGYFAIVWFHSLQVPAVFRGLGDILRYFAQASYRLETALWRIIVR
jgi:hypothetical protein